MTGPWPPRTVAVVGASPRNFWTRWAVTNLRGFGYRGRILPVNPTRGEVWGIPAWPAVADLPIVPDLGIVGIPSDACAAAVAELRKRGCRHVVVMSDGFAETGTATGVQRQEELVAAAAGATLLGPNGMGFADFPAYTVAVGGPLPSAITPGPVSIVTASGGLLASMLSGLAADGVGADLAISIGNGATFSFADALEVCGRRPATRVVAAYMEGIGDEAPRLVEVLGGLADRGIAVLVVAPGSSAAARSLVESHTARAAGPRSTVTALLRRYGAVVFEDLETLTRAAAVASLPEGSRRRSVAIVGSSGGAASLAADLAGRYGVPLAEYPEQLRQKLTALIPSSGTVGNPLDLSGGQVDAGAVFREVGGAATVGVLLLTFPAPFPDGSEARSAHRDYLEKAAEASSEVGVPLLVASMAPQPVPAWTAELASRYPLMRVVEGMAKTLGALGALWERQAELSLPSPQPRPPTPGTLSEEAGRQELRQAGLAVVPGVACLCEEEVADASRRLGVFPQVVKGILPGVAHKAAAGAVVLGVCTPGEATAAARDVRAAAGASVQGFLVEEMVFGTELFVGLVRDGNYGTSVTFGAGGPLVETGLASATEAGPLDGEQARRLVGRSGLLGVVGDTHRLAAVVRYLVTLSDAFCHGALARWAAVEINPLILTGAGSVVAADVTMVPPPPGERRG